MLRFNSQICTTKEQSKRLLALGLKKETADMFWWDIGDGPCVVSRPADKEDREYGEVIPAWSLHRLIEMIGEPYNFSDWLSRDICGHYNNAIDFIEWLIKEGYFNEEYLQEQAGSSREG